MTEEKKLTGYPSIDKPWLKYYVEESATAVIPKHSIYDHIWENNKNHLDDIALVFYNRKITYRELFNSIDRVARAFVSIGVKENDIVTLLMLNQPETVYCLYALSKIGAITCVINVLSSSLEIEQYLSEGKSKYFITLDLFFEKSYKAAKNSGVKKLIHVPLFYSRDAVHRLGYQMKVKVPRTKDNYVLSWRDFLRIKTSEPLPEVTRESSNCSIIGHTGGTTGFPKGIMLSDDAFNAIATQYVYAFEHVRQDSFLNLIVPFAIYGLVGNLHMPLSLGMKVILIPKVDPETVDELIIKYKPNYIVSIPAYWNSVINSKKITDLSFLKLAAAGGSGFSYEQIVQLNEKFQKCHAGTELLMGYGMSEVGSIVTTQKNGNAVPHSVGFPLPQNIVAAFDMETMEEKPYNEVGEICINSPSIMIGYLNNEEETSQALKVHEDGRVWMHTGDLGYVDDKGNVFIQGRLKRIYLTEYHGAPSKIFPDRIEQTLMRHSALSECGVICVSEVENIYKPIAFCVLKDENKTEIVKTEREMRVLCKEELPEYDLPIRYYFLDSIPHSGHGKVDYRTLEKMAKEDTVHA